MTMALGEATPPQQLTALADTLVHNLIDHVAALRHLHHLLDHDTVADAELRRVTRPIFTDTVDILALMRGFRRAIQRIDHNEVTAHTLMQPAAMDDAMTGWIRDVHDADQLIHADLASMRALLGTISPAIIPDNAAAHHTVELIDTITRNAIDRLDRATPPNPDRDRDRDDDRFEPSNG